MSPSIYRRFCTLLPALLVVVALAPATEPQQKRPKNRPSNSAFVYGINLPWFNGQYGHDIGPDPAHPDWRIWYRPDVVEDHFRDIRKIGFRCVRYWLMERAQGILFDAEGFVSDLDPTFLANLDDLLKRASDADLRVYLCLTTTWSDVPYKSPARYPHQQQQYLQKVVRPLAERLRGNSAVFAIDIFNEIEYDLAAKTKSQQITVQQAKTFIHKCALAIKAADPDRLVSAGTGWNGWKAVQDGHFRNLGLDFYDIHVYRDDGYLPHLRELRADKPVIVGECGQKTKKVDDDLQKKCILAFIRNAREKGYAGCFPWEYGHSATDPQLQLVRENGEYRPVVEALKEQFR